MEPGRSCFAAVIAVSAACAQDMPIWRDFSQTATSAVSSFHVR